MVCKLNNKPLVLRVFDIGGEKQLGEGYRDEMRSMGACQQEANPALGCRAIRFLMKFPDILITQLRAALRASFHGEIHLLIPMVSGLEEIQAFDQLLRKVRLDLLRERHPVRDKIPVGCMVEIPSLAFIMEAVLENVDFISLGTNDLVQYLLAADRSNPHMADLYSAPHPSLFRLISPIVRLAHDRCKSLIVCGEMASDPLAIPVLLGLGIQDFSVAARHVVVVKEVVRSWRFLDAVALAEEVLTLNTASEVKELLEGRRKGGYGSAERRQ
jgi:phosphotransferase system enzyme I (PtsI)